MKFSEWLELREGTNPRATRPGQIPKLVLPEGYDKVLAVDVEGNYHDLFGWQLRNPRNLKETGLLRKYENIWLLRSNRDQQFPVPREEEGVWEKMGRIAHSAAQSLGHGVHF